MKPAVGRLTLEIFEYGVTEKLYPFLREDARESRAVYRVVRTENGVRPDTECGENHSQDRYELQQLHNLQLEYHVNATNRFPGIFE